VIIATAENRARSSCSQRVPILAPGRDSAMKKQELASAYQVSLVWTVLKLNIPQFAKDVFMETAFLHHSNTPQPVR
jgi:hypothetical protein